MKFIVKYIVVLLFIISTANNLFAIDKWTKIISPINFSLYKSSFVDTSNGWVCGENGTMLHTSNGGLNWILQRTNTDYQIVYVTFLNKNLGWAIGNKYIYTSPVIYSTLNGGTNWDLFYYPDTTLMFNTIYFYDSLNGYIGGYGGLILKTTNSGANWYKTQSDSSLFAKLTIKSFHFINPNTGFACGGRLDLSGVVWKTTNAGNFWQSISVSPEPLNQFIFFDSINAISVGGDFDFGGSIIRTSNSGANWIYEPLPFLGIGFTIYNRTSAEWWIGLGYALEFLYTTNYGTNWDFIPLPDSTGIYDINFPDSTHGWAFGFFGSILKYDYSTTGISNGNIVINNFKLFQNYPNPFNPTTNIKYQIENNNFVTLKIYDILGREIKTLVNEKQSPGTYEVIFDGSGFPSGIYFCRINAGNFSDIKKMLLIK